MIIRYALFKRIVKPGKTKEFREAVLTSILPRWKQMPGALAVRVTFAEARDEDAPEYPLIWLSAILIWRLLMQHWPARTAYLLKPQRMKSCRSILMAGFIIM